MKKLAAAIAVVAVVAGCGGSDSASDTPKATATERSASSPTPNKKMPKLQFKVTGSCVSGKGTLRSKSSGFTPGGSYTTDAWYPNGRHYTDMNRFGKAWPDGITSSWQWPCDIPDSKGRIDPPGKYKIRMTDNTTGRTVTTYLKVGKP